MKAFAKISAPATAVVAVVAFGAMSENKASAGEFCRQDVTGHMTGCGFDSMEQCKAASAATASVIRFSRTAERPSPIIQTHPA